MRALVLPGMDGTGLLLGEFAAALAPRIDATVVTYPPTGPGDYDTLTAHAAAQLPRDVPWLLIAESFSGPIAIRLAARRPPGLAGLVLCGTFARTPRSTLPGPLARLAALLPLHRMPRAWLHAAMLGRWSTPEWRSRTEDALARVDPATLRARLAAVRTVDATDALRQVTVPVLYLQASEDRVVPRESAAHIASVLPAMRVSVIDGPHFLLQVHAQACADAIIGWLPRTSPPAP